MGQKDTEKQRERKRQRCRDINHWTTICQTKDKNISCSPLGHRLKEPNKRDGRMEMQ